MFWGVSPRRFSELNGIYLSCNGSLRPKDDPVARKGKKWEPSGEQGRVPCEEAVSWLFIVGLVGSLECIT